MNRNPGEGSVRVAVRRSDAPGREDTDAVVVEEPVLIELAWPDGSHPVSVTMRTPGDDAALALGFLHGEGILARDAEVTAMECNSDAQGDVVRVHLAQRPADGVLDRERNFFMTSSCGICGKAALDAIKIRSHGISADPGFMVPAATLRALPATMAEQQRLFAGTGSIHAAALFDAAGLCGPVAEDIGRHNALDKLIGNALRSGALPLSGRGILLSGRAGFELVQKAAMAGCPLLAAVGAPSSLAVELAWETGMTLVGFLRDGRFNVYAVPGRIAGLS